MSFVTAFFAGANYRRLGKSLRSQRATEQNTDDMLRLAVARSEPERATIAGTILSERDRRAKHLSAVRQTKAALFVGLIIAIVVAVSYLSSAAPSPTGPQRMVYRWPNNSGPVLVPAADDDAAGFIVNNVGNSQ